MPVCEHCGDTKHIRTDKGWRRCVCSLHSLVHPVIRHGEASYPVKYDTDPPWAPKDLVYVGDYTEWRHRVWRAVLHVSATYDYLDAYRLVEIHFGQDGTYQNVRELVPLGVLMVVLGLAELPNKFIGPTVCQVLTLRQHMAQPTWVYSPIGLTDQFRAVYGQELLTMLKALPLVSAGEASSVRPNISHR